MASSTHPQHSVFVSVGLDGDSSLNLSSLGDEHGKKDDDDDTTEPHNKSYSAGSSVSQDSFIDLTGLQLGLEEEDSDSYDPFLRRRPWRSAAAAQKPQHTYVKAGFHLSPQSPGGYTTHPESSSDDASPAESSNGSPPPLLPPALSNNTTTRTSSSSHRRSASAPLIPTRVHIPTQPSLPRVACGTTETFPESTPNALRELQYWKQVVRYHQEYDGKAHSLTLHASLQLGTAHMACHEYKEALSVLTPAVRQLKHLYGTHDLRVAQGMCKMGQAVLSEPSPKSLHCARVALTQALHIRFSILGATHADTVEALNQLAAVHVVAHEWSDALEAYTEVFVLRQTIFGMYHPSVAVAAQALGGIHMRLSQLKKAQAAYHMALAIYQKMGLTCDHGTVKKLLKDMNSMEQVLANVIVC